jgi:hypothetical protein
VTRRDDVAGLLAEYAVLELFDDLREHAGHDYGCGQRGAELRRRRLALRDRGFDVELDRGLLELGHDELVEAFERIGRPRLRRIELETYRHETPASRRTLRTWRRVEAELGRRARTFVDEVRS